MTRSTINDGSRKKLETFFLTNFELFWDLAVKIPGLQRRLNKFLINRAVHITKSRPYSFSTLSSFTSWESLTDRTYYGLHLPPVDRNAPEPPSVETVAQLFKRQGPPTCSPKSTLLFAYFAQWFTDGFLRTDRSNKLKNTSNHEIDLSPLYGLNPHYTRMLRSGSDGKLKSQVINGEHFPPFYFDDSGEVKPEFKDLPIHLPEDLDARLKPYIFAMGGDRANVQIGYVMLNTLFLREHNRICDVLKAVPLHSQWDDERLFQTARNILIVMLITIVVEEYINHISPFYFKFSADPASFYDATWYRTNWICMEFNLLYRWHSLIPDQVLLGGQDHPVTDSFWNNNYIISLGLGTCFQDASNQSAGEIGLFNTAPFLMDVECASIAMGRLAGLRSYNDYRAVCGLPRITDFDQISSRPEIQKALRDVYTHVDNIEFYVGLFAEDTTKNAVVPSLIGQLVAVDAFSQALTNPILSENVFNEATFTPTGMNIIKETKTLSQILNRNLPPQSPNFYVSMTQKTWKRV